MVCRFHIISKCVSLHPQNMPTLVQLQPARQMHYSCVPVPSPFVTMHPSTAGPGTEQRSQGLAICVIIKCHLAPDRIPQT